LLLLLVLPPLLLPLQILLLLPPPRIMMVFQFIHLVSYRISNGCIKYTQVTVEKKTINHEKGESTIYIYIYISKTKHIILITEELSHKKAGKRCSTNVQKTRIVPSYLKNGRTNNKETRENSHSGQCTYVLI
jgi:hypothetical protein